MGGKIRLGVIGTGLAWNNLHYPALQELSDLFEITALCNRTADKARAFAQRIGLHEDRVYTDCRDLLRRDDVDAVVLAVPIEQNHPMAREVILAGKPLLAEKPFAATPEQARELIDLKNSRGVKVLVGENFRYDEEAALLKDVVSRGALGEIMYFIQNTAYNFQPGLGGDSYGGTVWRQQPRFDGGLFLDGGVHDFARLRYIFGEVGTLYACARPQEEAYCPYMSLNALLRFECGVAGQYNSYIQGAELTAPPVGLRLYGTLGEAYLEKRETGVLRLMYRDGRREDKTFAPDRGYVNEFKNFHGALTRDEPIVSTPETELGDIELVGRILRSARENGLS